jgi:hypothetical protein
MLDHQIARHLKGGRKMTLPELVDAMEVAGTVDLRGMTALPLALRMLGKPRDTRLAAAVATLRAWQASGSRRLDRNKDGTYDDAAAVRIMDAWWPKLISAMFEPVMGKPLLERLEATNEIDNEPNNHGAHLGSAYQTGFYGYVVKDLSACCAGPSRRSTRWHSAGAAGRPRAARPSSAR